LDQQTTGNPLFPGNPNHGHAHEGHSTNGCYGNYLQKTLDKSKVFDVFNLKKAINKFGGFKNGRRRFKPEYIFMLIVNLKKALN